MSRLFIQRRSLYTAPAILEIPSRAVKVHTEPDLKLNPSLALPSISSLSHSPPYSVFSHVSSPLPSIPSPTIKPHSKSKRHRLKYRLDVGAYGIPKKCAPHTPIQTPEDLHLSVQVGEDAYFVRDNAMGIADGVGGWPRRESYPLTISPSALFARRLMHFCSAEIDRPHSPRPQISYHHRQSSPYTSISNTQEELEQQLEDSLEELSEGIDVLQILETAYSNSIKPHAVTKPPEASAPPPNPTPLLSGSSTALLAVLDSIPSSPTLQPHSPPPPPTTHPQNFAAGNCTLEPSFDDGCDAVLKIAHVGDCMGMLVRGESIAWRTEEMWWNFNTPVQLGPTTPTTPSNSAHIFTLPVRADDILILASDGLSDNLWDEDVLDEVVRFRRGFLYPDLPAHSLLRRRTLATMLSEALCSRARRVVERGIDEVPFARRAREVGKFFKGGKSDDISVIVAVVSPGPEIAKSESSCNSSTLVGSY